MKGVLIEKPEKSRNKIAKTYHSRFDNEKIKREAESDIWTRHKGD